MSKKKQSRGHEKAGIEPSQADKAKEEQDMPVVPEDEPDSSEAGEPTAGTPETEADPEAAPAKEETADSGIPAEPDLLEALEQERDQYKNALVRERADFENYKKRNASLSAASFANGTEAAVAAVLPVLDNFERALAAECSDKTYAEGMQLIMRQLQSALESLGVQEIDTTGAFDPTYHHAVMQVEEEDLDSGQIAETLQKGYKLKDKVVRPAMVKVNK